MINFLIGVSLTILVIDVAVYLMILRKEIRMKMIHPSFTEHPDMFEMVDGVLRFKKRSE